MPDLERSSVLQWLRALEPRLETLCGPAVRSVEDAKEVKPLLVDLGRALDAAAAPATGRLAAALRDGDSQLLRDVLAQLGPARLLRLLDWLEGTLGQDGDNGVPELLLQDTASETGQALRATLDALHSKDLLDRIFAPEKLQALVEACREPLREAA